MDDAFRTIAVEPIGHRETAAFVSRSNGQCGLESISLPEYPRHEHQYLRRARLEFGHTLGGAARVLGMRAVEVSEIEQGARRFADDGEYERAIEALRRAATEGSR